jgi:hypothetical protein
MTEEQCLEELKGNCTLGTFYTNSSTQEKMCQCRVIKLNKYYWKDLGTIPADTCEAMESSVCEPTSIEYSEPHVVVYEMNPL